MVCKLLNKFLEAYEKKRTLVIGDIHGNYKGLLQCLERCQFDNEKSYICKM
jgi:hypothetical protein